MKLNETLLLDTVLSALPMDVTDDEARRAMDAAPATLWTMVNCAANHEQAVRAADAMANWVRIQFNH